MDDDLTDRLPGDFYTQVIIAVQDRAPLLAVPRLARLAAASLDACAPDAPGQLWGYLVLPDAIRLIVGPTGEDALDTFVEAVKAHSSARLLDAILRADDDSLDAVLRYNPVWGGAIYQVWQAGYHRQDFWTEYRLSNALYEMMRLPAAMGLVERAEEWPYRYVGR